MVGTRGAAVHLPVPDGSSFIVVCGSVGPNRGEMVVEWEPPIRDGGERINTSSWRSVPTTTLYVRRLDPYLAHNLSLQMDGTVGLESVSFYNAWAVPAMSVYVLPNLFAELISDSSTFSRGRTARSRPRRRER